MRLARLDLIAFGPFAGTSLDFTKPGLHVVFGRNEAGKSTTLRAVTGLLYGIDARTQDAHVHKPADLRVGGVVERADGTRLQIVRRKGNAGTLLAPDGTALGDDALRPFVRAVTEDTFRHAFGLDHDSLRRGAEGLLTGKGDLGESLFDASSGGAGDVQRLLASLEAAADGLYRPRGSTQAVNQALKAFEQAQKRIAERQSLPAAYLKQEEHLTALRATLAQRVARRDALRAEKERLERAQRRAPLERRLGELAALRTRGAALVENAARLSGLGARLGAYESDVRTLAELRAERAITEGRLQEAAKATGRSTVRLEPRVPARLTKLLHERDALAVKIVDADEAIARIERERARAEATLAEAPSDATALAVALEAAQALGDAEGRLESETTRIERKRRELTERAVALGTSADDLAAIVALVLPGDDEVGAIERRAQKEEARATRLESRVAELDVSLQQIERQIAEASGDFAPPDARQLEAARRARDEALARVLEGVAPTRAEAAAIDRLVRDADALADRMIREADRVTSLARLRSAAGAQETQREAARAELAEASAARDAAVAELAKAFAHATRRPVGFETARALVARHAQVCAAHAELGAAEGELADLSRTVARVREDLARALGAGGGEADLRALVALARTRQKEHEARTRARDDAAHAKTNADAALEERRDARARDAARIVEVKAELDALGAPLGLQAATATAEEVHAAIETARAVEGAEAAAREAALRATAAEAATASFEDDVRALARTLAPDLADFAPRDVGATLVARFEEARAVMTEAETVERQLAPLRGEGDAPAAWGVEEERRLEAVVAELERLEDEVAHAARDIGGAEEGLRAMRGESHAAEAAAEAHEALARVRAQVERYCRTRLAHAILLAEIDRFRDENQGPLLARASQLYARLTLGAYTSVRAGVDERDRACLTCVRAGGTPVPVTGLSEGTRDQLYLALRLASLERHAEAADPMPLLLDDVLVQLDDERARAALEVLAETATRMQVLFFTHHARLVELAREAIPEGRLVVHELSRRDAPAATAPTLVAGSEA